MKNLFILATTIFAFLSLSMASAESAASSEQPVLEVTAGAEPTDAAWLGERVSAASCNPSENVPVDRFYADFGAGTQSGTIAIRVLVDGEVYGTERLSMRQPATADAARLELLRFQPRERLRLLELVAEGALVEIQSEALAAGKLPLEMLVEARGQSPDLRRVDSISDATITSSTWRRGEWPRSDQSGLRNLFAAHTYSECMDACSDVENDCISYWNCHPDDDQCLWACAEEQRYCEEDCPCQTGPVLVDQYSVTEVHYVSGPHRTICAGNIFNFNNSAYYDEYVIFYRVKKYEVWEDCHGYRTTTLVSTTDSSNRYCYSYSGQICSSFPSQQPPCVLD